MKLYFESLVSLGHPSVWKAVTRNCSGIFLKLPVPEDFLWVHNTTTALKQKDNY